MASFCPRALITRGESESRNSHATRRKGPKPGKDPEEEVGFGGPGSGVDRSRGQTERHEGALRRAEVPGLEPRVCLHLVSRGRPVAASHRQATGADVAPKVRRLRAGGPRAGPAAWRPNDGALLPPSAADVRPRARLPRGRERGRCSGVLSTVGLDEGGMGEGPAARTPSREESRSPLSHPAHPLLTFWRECVPWPGWAAGDWGGPQRVCSVRQRDDACPHSPAAKCTEKAWTEARREPWLSRREVGPHGRRGNHQRTSSGRAALYFIIYLFFYFLFF